MGMLDGLPGAASKIDLGAIASQLGMSPEELMRGGEALLSRLAGGGQDAAGAAAGASAATGIPLDKLQALLPLLAAQFGEGGVQALLAQLAGEGGLLAGLDKNKDGNPLDDIAGMAKGLFG